MTKKSASSVEKSPNHWIAPTKSNASLKVSVLCPTRGRPENAKRLLESVKKTHVGPVAIGFYCDVDDPRLSEYDVPHMTGPDFKFAMKCEVLVSKTDGDILMMVGDDAVFKTEGWDNALRGCQEVWPDGIWAASMWDGTRGKEIEGDDKRRKLGHPHPAVGRAWHDAVGYLAHPMFIHFCTDPWITSMAMELERFMYFPEILCDHRRAGLVKDVEQDDTYKRMRPDGQATISVRDRSVSRMFERYRILDRETLRSKMYVQCHDGTSGYQNPGPVSRESVSPGVWQSNFEFPPEGQ